MTRKKTGFRCKENGEENWLGATRAGERDGVESVAISSVELKPKLHRTRASHLQLRAASGSKRATKGDEKAFKEDRTKKRSNGTTLRQRLWIKTILSICTFSKVEN